MILNYNVEIDNNVIQNELKKLTNQIYKLLPMREENSDWIKPLETIMEEFFGMTSLLVNQHKILFPLLCKLEGLFYLDSEEDFFLFRREIFECLSLINTLKKEIE